MLKNIVLYAVMAGLAWGAETFPVLEGENLLGQKVALPEAVKGRPTVVVTGFAHAANGQMNAWGKRLEAEYQPWSIAVLEDAPRLVRGMARHGTRTPNPAAVLDAQALIPSRSHRGHTTANQRTFGAEVGCRVARRINGLTRTGPRRTRV